MDGKRGKALPAGWAIGLCLPLGAGIGLALDNLALGAGLGVIVGAVLSSFGGSTEDAGRGNEERPPGAPEEPEGTDGAP